MVASITIVAIDDVASDFEFITGKISELESLVSEIEASWTGDASVSYITKVRSQIENFKEVILSKEEKTSMYSLYKNGMVQAKKTYAKYEQSVIAKIEEIPFLDDITVD